MHQPLTKEQLAELQQPTMARNERLERWASLLEKCPCIGMGDRIEYSSNMDALTWAWSPMGVAYGDAVLKDAGLAGPTVGDTRKFFELSAEQIHDMSCNCGGHLSGKDMASRIRSFKD